MSLLHKIKRLILTAIFIVVCNANIYTQEQHSSLISEKIIETIQTRVDSGRTPGIIVATVDSFGVIDYYSYGHLTYNSNKEINEYSMFNIGSMTKIFTTLLFAVLVDHGEIKINDPIAKYLPEGIKFPRCDVRQSTMLDLATHNSGLPMNMYIADYDNPFIQTKKEIYDYIDTCGLAYCPDDSSVYSNIGVALLGLLIEDFMNDSYMNLLDRYVLNELNLNNTLIDLPDSLSLNRAKGHLRGNQVESRSFDAMSPAGALKSNAHDLINFISCQLGHKNSKISNSIDKTHQKYHDIYLTGHETMCMSWFYRDRYGSNFYRHGGTVKGYKTFTGFDLDKGIGVVVLTNSFCFIDDIGWHILNNNLHIRTWNQFKDYNY